MSDQLLWISFLLMLGCLADPLRAQLLQLYSGDVDPRTTGEGTQLVGLMQRLLRDAALLRKRSPDGDTPPPGFVGARGRRQEADGPPGFVGARGKRPSLVIRGLADGIGSAMGDAY
ncbi:hypothetical protein ISCGN_003086 [Ixodes scapularis]